MTALNWETVRRARQMRRYGWESSAGDFRGFTAVSSRSDREEESLATVVAPVAIQYPRAAIACAPAPRPGKRSRGEPPASVKVAVQRRRGSAEALAEAKLDAKLRRRAQAIAQGLVECASCGCHLNPNHVARHRRRCTGRTVPGRAQVH